MKYKKLLFLTILAVGFLFANPAQAVVEISDGSVKYLYHLDNNASDTANAKDFTIVGGEFTIGKISQGFNTSSTNGTLGGLFTNAATLMTSVNDFTFGFWMQPKATVGDGSYIITTDENTVVALNFGRGILCNLGNFEVKVSSTCSDAAQTFTNDTWYWIVAQRGGTILDIYINNSLFFSETSASTWTSPNRFRVSWQGGGGQGTHAIFDEIFFATSSISTTTRDNLWNSGNGDSICLTVGCGGGAAAPVNRSVIIIISQKIKELFSPLIAFAYTREEALNVTNKFRLRQLLTWDEFHRLVDIWVRNFRRAWDGKWPVNFDKFNDKIRQIL